GDRAAWGRAAGLGGLLGAEGLEGLRGPVLLQGVEGRQGPGTRRPGVEGGRPRRAFAHVLAVLRHRRRGRVVVGGVRRRGRGEQAAGEEAGRGRRVGVA